MVTKKKLVEICMYFGIDSKKNLSKLSKSELVDVLNDKLNRLNIIDADSSHGDGFFSNLVDKFKKIFFFPANKLPKGSQQVFEKYKSNRIIGLRIQREPIMKGVELFLNLVTAGKFKEAKEKAYDTLFHLSLIVKLDNGRYILIEKNERINISEKVKSTVESLPVHYPKPIVTLDQFLDKTKNFMGEHDFFQYNARRNNCQSFIASILTANGVATNENINFVKQNAESIFAELPSYLETMQQFITDTAGVVG